MRGVVGDTFDETGHASTCAAWREEYHLGNGKVVNIQRPYKYYMILEANTAPDHLPLLVLLDLVLEHVSVLTLFLVLLLPDMEGPPIHLGQLRAMRQLRIYQRRRIYVIGPDLSTIELILSMPNDRTTVPHLKHRANMQIWPRCTGYRY